MPLESFIRQPSIAEHLAENSFAVIDLLQPAEVDRLWEVYRKHQSDINATTINGIHMTTWIADIPMKLTIKKELEEAIFSAVAHFFNDFKLLNSIFIIKNQHKVSNFPLHQDWSFVDETTFPSLNVWIALQDTTVRNGGLYVVRGSHKLNNTIRGAGKLSFDFTRYGKELQSYLYPVVLKRGQAVLFYYSTIHGSPANLTADPRVVVATTVVPQEAPIIINYLDTTGNTLYRYELSDDFIYHYTDIRQESVQRPPKGKLISSIKDYMPSDITLDAIRQCAQPVKLGIIQQIIHWFR